MRPAARDPRSLMAISTPGRAPSTPPAQPEPLQKGRLRKPSAKVLEAQQPPRTRTTTSRGARNEPSPPPFSSAAIGGAGEGANLNEVVRLITILNETISQQSSIINSVQADLIEIKSEQRSLKIQNAELQDEIRSLRTQLNTYSASLPSWASIAASGSINASSASLSRTTDTEISKKDSSCLRISTQPIPDAVTATDITFTRYLPTDSANTYIRNALLNGNATKDAQVVGIGTTKTGYVIRFKDQQSAETARTNTEWLEELGNGTKLVKPRFGIVVHRTPTEGFMLPENKTDSINRIMEENDLSAKGFQINDIAWLKSKDKPLSRSASLGIWFDTAEAAEWAMYNGLVFRQRYIGSIEPYQIKRKRCHRCQRFGHLAWSCKEQMRCGHCAGEHDRRRCPPGTAAKCVDCSGAHPTGDKDCGENIHY